MPFEGFACLCSPLTFLFWSLQLSLRWVGPGGSLPVAQRSLYPSSGRLRQLRSENYKDWDFPGGQRLRLHISSAGGTDSVPNWGTKLPQLAWCGQKKKIKGPLLQTDPMRVRVDSQSQTLPGEGKWASIVQVLS